MVKSIRYALRANSIVRNLQVLGVSSRKSKEAVGVIIMMDSLVALIGKVGQVIDGAITWVMKRIIARRNATTVTRYVSARTVRAQYVIRTRTA